MREASASRFGTWPRCCGSRSPRRTSSGLAAAAARAAAAERGVLDEEAGPLGTLDEIDDRAVRVRLTHRIHRERDTRDVADRVLLVRRGVEREAVLVGAAALAGHIHPKEGSRRVRAAELAELLGRDRCHLDHRHTSFGCRSGPHANAALGEPRNAAAARRSRSGRRARPSGGGGGSWACPPAPRRVREHRAHHGALSGQPRYRADQEGVVSVRGGPQRRRDLGRHGAIRDKVGERQRRHYDSRSCFTRARITASAAKTVAAAPATAAGAPNAIAAPPRIGPFRTRMPCVPKVYAPITRPRSSFGADSWIFVFVSDCVSTALAPTTRRSRNDSA